ncbi:MAG: hypothetical protein JNM60_10060 [Candidatus Competibacteraceae bacterium]|nr:hypothetical protein [Candidatus Competibacteraceae bacterium]
MKEFIIFLSALLSIPVAYESTEEPVSLLIQEDSQRSLSNNRLMDSNNTTKNYNQNTSDLSNKNDDNNWLYLLFGTPVGIWYWNKYVRRRCPNCRSTKFECIALKELDRWRQTERVTERTSTGKSRDRHVQFT